MKLVIAIVLFSDVAYAVFANDLQLKRLGEAENIDIDELDRKLLYQHTSILRSQLFDSINRIKARLERPVYGDDAVELKEFGCVLNWMFESCVLAGEVGIYDPAQNIVGWSEYCSGDPYNVILAGY